MMAILTTLCGCSQNRKISDWTLEKGPPRAIYIPIPKATKKFQDASYNDCNEVSFKQRKFEYRGLDDNGFLVYQESVEYGC